MNHSNMLTLANAVDQMGDQFSMQNYWSVSNHMESLINNASNNLPPCGTSCCIAGEAVILFNTDNLQHIQITILNLTDQEWDYLIMGKWSSNGLDEHDPLLASQAIRKMVKDDQLII